MTKSRTARTALAAVALALGLSTLTPSQAVSRPTSFRDSFDTLGPLAGHLPSDPYEIKRGQWEVVDLPDLLTATNPRRVLRQNSKAGTPKPGNNEVEPIVFVRDTSFRALSVQVTAALIDNEPASSLGIVFRAPVLEDQTADPNNLYLFNAINARGASGFPTGKGFVLYKRVGQGYFMLDNKIAHTWIDLTKPHVYKVTMVDGHIRAFVDGRLVLEHTDIPSGDTPTNADRFPGLPFHEGTVGLRTSNARAWFDDLIVVADDAFEARAALADQFVSNQLPTSPPSGVELTASNELAQWGVPAADTGMVYEDRPFDRSVIAPYSDGRVEAGASLRVRSEGDEAVATSRAARVNASFSDPLGRVTVELEATKIETEVRASCTATSSSVDLGRSELTIRIGSSNGAPDTVIGPFPISSSYAPNTVLYKQPGLFEVIAHRRIVSSKPRWVQASALSIVFPTGDMELSEINVAGNRILPRTSLGRSPGLITDIGLAVAGRYCAPQLEGNG